MWNISYIELWLRNQVSYDPRSYNAIYAIAYVEAWKPQDFNSVQTPWPRDTC